MSEGGHAPEAVRVVSGRDQQRRDIFAFLIKRSYLVNESGQCIRSEHASVWQETDEYYGDPASSSVRFESDVVPFKCATDIVVIGHVHAPYGSPVTELQAGIQIGTTRKVFAVFGTRTAWFQAGTLPNFTDPKPFTRLPLVYECAYGGVDSQSIEGLEFAYPRNPVGCGLAVGNTCHAKGLRLPNYEDPKDLLSPERLILGDPRAWNRQPFPQGLGWYSKTWYPRSSYVGAFPGFVDAGEVMREEELGLVPRGQISLARQFRLPSFDVRFNNGAVPGMSLANISGNEAIRLLHLTPDDAHRSFFLPGERPIILADIGAGEQETEVALHSVVIQPDTMRVDLIWRGALHYPGPEWLPHMRRLSSRVA